MHFSGGMPTGEGAAVAAMAEYGETVHLRRKTGKR